MGFQLCHFLGIALSANDLTSPNLSFLISEGQRGNRGNKSNLVGRVQELGIYNDNAQAHGKQSPNISCF